VLLLLLLLLFLARAKGGRERTAVSSWQLAGRLAMGAREPAWSSKLVPKGMCSICIERNK
jgi:hypothetical protein